jgi:hypothetical protein
MPPQLLDHQIRMLNDGTHPGQPPVARPLRHRQPVMLARAFIDVELKPAGLARAFSSWE